MVRITAAICTFNRYALLERAVESLWRQSLPAEEFRILVVDNSPDQAAARAFGERYAGRPALDYWVEPVPGIANARNVAVRRAEGEFVAFLDDDMQAPPNWLAEILAVFARQPPETAAVGGKVLPLWEVPRPPWLADSLLAFLSMVDYGETERETGSEEWLSGGNLTLRRGAVEAIGGFRRDLGRSGAGLNLMSNEEVDLLTRLRAAGHRIVYAPSVTGEHFVPAERLTRAWFRRRVAWQATSDFMTDPEATRQKALRELPKLYKILGNRPWRASALQRLAGASEDPKQFPRQLWALYRLTIALLAGLEDAR